MAPFTLANSLAYVAFLLSVLVQYNDPDPYSWMAIYSAAALVCVLFTARMLPVWFAVVVVLVSVVWGLMLAYSAVTSAQEISLGAVFGSVAMMNERVELAREAGGLAIVAMWSAILAALAYRRSSR